MLQLRSILLSSTVLAYMEEHSRSLKWGWEECYYVLLGHTPILISCLICLFWFVTLNLINCEVPDIEDLCVLPAPTCPLE